MIGKEVMFSTYQAARYVARRNIPGYIVECGVWREGSALLATLAVRAVEKEGLGPKQIEIVKGDISETLNGPKAARDRFFAPRHGLV